MLLIGLGSLPGDVSRGRGLKLPEMRARAFCTPSKGNKCRECMVHTGTKNALLPWCTGSSEENGWRENLTGKQGPQSEDYHQRRSRHLCLTSQLPDVTDSQTHPFQSQKRRQGNDLLFAFYTETCYKWENWESKRLSIWIKFQTPDETQGPCHLLDSTFFPVPSICSGHSRQSRSPPLLCLNHTFPRRFTNGDYSLIIQVSAQKPPPWGDFSDHAVCTSPLITVHPCSLIFFTAWTASFIYQFIFLFVFSFQK